MCNMSIGTGTRNPATIKINNATISRLIILPNRRTASAMVRVTSLIKLKGNRIGLGFR